MTSSCIFARRLAPAALLAIIVTIPATSASAMTYLTGPSADDPLQIVLTYVSANRDALELTSADLAQWSVSDRYVTQKTGVTHLYLRQTTGGIELYNGILTAAVDKDGRLLHLTSRWMKDLPGSINTTAPALTASDAVRAAAAKLGLADPGELAPREKAAGPARAVTFDGGDLSLDAIPARLAFVSRKPGDARLAWDLRIRPDDSHAWQVQVDAMTGEELGRHDLVQRDSYKVYAAPAESPNHVAAPLPLPPGDGREIVTQAAADPTASPFGWHDLNGLPGADTITTTGNNVAAQTDLDMNDVFTPGTDVLPQSLTRDFVHPVDFSMEPTTYREALVTNLFYWNNVSHDIHYLYGFDEASGNFQTNTYARGGVGGDGVQADAQDGSGTNNANFLTLPDGAPGRMQMFLWIAPPSVVGNSPSSIAGNYDSLAAAFGATLDATGVTADLQLVNDGTANAEEGCGALIGFTAGRIALIRRGTCEFGVKVLNAENAGAVAAIIFNNQGEDLVSMGPGASGGSVTIPSVFVAQSTGELFRTALAGGPANVTLKKVRPDRDSDFDNAVILHEYGHGVSTRLTGGPQMVTCLTNDQQGGEGWSDWWALALTARAADTAVQPRGVGTYLVFEDPPAFGGGIRPYPYSTDMSVNPQTYGDLTTGTLTVPHGVGSVWATILWDMYWALVDGVPAKGLAGSGFRQNLYDLTPPLAGNQIALQLVMDGLKLQPCNPSFVDARDAILAADLALTGGAHECHIWHAFARRGVGVHANDGGGTLQVTEDFTLPQQCVVGPCVQPPTFAGVARVTSDQGTECRLTVEWNDALNNCGGNQVTYDLHRSTDPAFVPGQATLLLSDTTALSYVDGNVESGTHYYYLARARDHLGNTDGNLVRGDEVAGGPLGPVVALADDAGDTSGPHFFAAPTPGNGWSVRAAGGVGDSAVHATSPAGNYADNSCQALQTGTIHLGDNPVLSFSTSYAIEPGWDGGIVEVATAAGGFTNWTKLESIPYPGVRGGPLGDPPCNSPGLADGQPAFTGTSGGQFVPVSGSLAGYAGQAVRLRFLFAADGATNDTGWLVDDILVSEVREAGVCLTARAAGDVFDTLDVLHAGGGDVTLSWGASCAASDDDYAVYEGELGIWYSHAARLCSTGGAASATFTPAAASSYYLVVPRNALREGSYGPASDGSPRPPGAGACVAQEVSPTCP